MELKDVKNTADRKFVEQFFGDDFYGPEMVTRQNQFSGESIEVSKGVAKLVDFVYDIQNIYTNATALKNYHSALTPRNSVSKFDRARTLVMKLNRNAYSILLD